MDQESNGTGVSALREGDVVPAQTDDAIETVSIEGYTLVREIGVGGMATVYLAYDERSGDQVAVKVMAPALQADRSFSGRFLKEASIMAELDHPNIARIISVGETGYSNYIVMEHLGGGDLKNRIRAGVVPRDALKICCQVANALTFAHTRGFVHRDVKPENILFRADGSPVLSDFGIARAVQAGTRMTLTGMSIGTPHYMSPEQARGASVDASADFYALGVVLYEALVGHLPYEAEDTYAIGLMHNSSPIPTLPNELRRYQFIVDNLMAKLPADRYRDADQLRAAVAAAGSARRVARPRHATRPHRLASDRRPVNPALAWGVGGSVAAAVLVGSIWALAPSQQAAVHGGGGPSAATTQLNPKPRPPGPTPTRARHALVDAGSSPSSPFGIAVSAGQGDADRIRALVKDADRQISESKWTTPDGDNAYETIKEILDLDPASEEARGLLERIAGRYAELAGDALVAGDRERALALVGNGLKIDPVNPALTDIQEAIFADVAAQEAQARASVAALNRSLAENQRELERLESQKAARGRELAQIDDRIRDGQLTEQQLADLEERKRALELEVRELADAKDAATPKKKPKFVGSF